MAQSYVEWTEKVMLEDGSLPELYFAGANIQNPNTPLGWSNAMYILAKEKVERKKSKIIPKKSRIKVVLLGK
jgi:GH15 family glucan-1,4-alpha-glucosidase